MAFASSGTEPAQRCREIKIVLLGDSGVGKSSIAQRYVTDTFRPHGESTIGASFMSKMIVNNGSPCKCQIWDTAGQEKYHSLAPMYYRGAAVVHGRQTVVLLLARRVPDLALAGASVVHDHLGHEGRADRRLAVRAERVGHVALRDARLAHAAVS